MAKIKRVHHLAMLVEDIDSSLQFWRDLLGITPSRIADMPAEAARIAFLPLGDCEIELVQPTTPNSGLSRFLEKRGPGMHHVCLQVDDLAGLLSQLKSKGVEMINDQPKADEEGRLYAFIHPKSTQGVLVELYQLPEGEVRRVGRD